MDEYTLELTAQLKVTIPVNDFTAIDVYGRISQLTVVILLIESVV